jgi:hypothetical protein
MDSLRLDKPTYTIAEVALLTVLSTSAVTRLFEREPGS